MSKTQATQIKNIIQSLNTFNRLSEPIPEVKNLALNNDGKNITYWEKSEQSKALATKFGLFQTQIGGLGGVVTPEHFAFPAIK